MPGETILVVEDEPSVARGLEYGLKSEGFSVLVAPTGAAALGIVRGGGHPSPQLMLLDIRLPDMSGFDVCRALREEGRALPILMVTARDEEVDKVLGLELGADDYIVKPFGVGELLARVRAALRRAAARAAGIRDTSPIEFSGIRIDPKTFTGTKGGRSFPVTAREIELLRFFRGRAGEVVDRFTLLDEIWGVRYEGTTRTLDQHIAKLRQKIEDDPAAPRFIQTVYGVGYRFLGKP